MNIEEDFIEKIAIEKNLSSIEIKIFRCIFYEGAKSIKNIQEKLKLPSYPATQKRLAKIYEKFQIDNENPGPGKLHELKEKVESQYFENNRVKKIILYWRTSKDKKFAEKFAEKILINIENLDIKICEQSIDYLNLELINFKKIDFGILFLVDNPINQSLVISGFLAGKIGNFKVATKGDLTILFSKIKVINLIKNEDIEMIIKSLVNDQNKSNEILNLNFGVWKNFLEDLDYNQKSSSDESEKYEFLTREELFFSAQPCLRLLCTYFDSNINFYIKKFEEYAAFPLPTLRYYEFLYSLQKMQNDKIKIQSTIFLNESEIILRSDIENKIIPKNKESRRIFIYKNQDEISRNIEVIAKHSAYYNVYIMDITDFYKSYKEIVNIQESDGAEIPKEESFVILDYEGSKVVGTNVEVIDDEYFFSQVMFFYPKETMIHVYQKWIDLIIKEGVSSTDKCYSTKIKSNYKAAIEQMKEVILNISRSSISLVTGS